MLRSGHCPLGRKQFVDMSNLQEQRVIVKVSNICLL